MQPFGLDCILRLRKRRNPRLGSLVRGPDDWLEAHSGSPARELYPAAPERHPRPMRSPYLLPLLFATLAAAAVAADLPGQRPDGSVLLPNQWVLRPVGKQIAVGDFPVNLAIHPEGKFAAVLH